MADRREHLRIGVECMSADEASARPPRRADVLAVLAGPSFNFLAPLKVWVSSEGHSRLHLAPASTVCADACWYWPGAHERWSASSSCSDRRGGARRCPAPRWVLFDR